MNITTTKTNPLRVILIAGLVAGTLDITAACIQFRIRTGKDPVIVLKYIASKVFGKERAYSDAEAMFMNTMGLLFHYLIATTFAAFFVFLYFRWKGLSKNIVIKGLLYGIFVWIVMNLGVVPLVSNAWPKFEFQKVLESMLILMFMIGLPIALITKKFYPR